MRILNVTLTVVNLDAAAAFYRDVLGLPVTHSGKEAVVRVGSSQLTLTRGDPFEGAHHLAFGIPPADFALARQWLDSVVKRITVGDSEVIEGPEGWNSESVYFLGPENIILELIARQADRGVSGSLDDRPQLIAISEVGVGVPHVPTAVKQLVRDLNVAPFPPQENRFAPVGDHDGLLILVEQDRVWFPTKDLRAARGSMTVLINTGANDHDVDRSESTYVLRYAPTKDAAISIRPAGNAG